ncbi:MAG TPA: TolC family protein [Nitrospira sp.]|nr:TolC family protein [Nitrospira sp.]
MNSRAGLSVLGMCLALLWSEPAEAKPLPLVQIAIVEDGSSHVVPELANLVQQEIREVTRQEFDVRFPDELKLQGGWSPQGVKQALDRVLADRRVNVVIALGFLATTDVSKRTHLPKPVIAPVALDPQLQGLPFKKGASGIKNLNYLTALTGFHRHVEAFKEVFAFSRLSVLADRMLLETIPSLESRVRETAEQYGIQLKIVPVDTSAQAALAALPADTDAVYVSVLPRLPSPEFDRLVAGLIERRLPSFSSLGQQEVERGIAASNSPDVDVRRLVRTVATNVQRILSGTDAGQIEVTFARGEHLTINMATVRTIDKWPSFQVLTEADLLNEDASAAAPRLSIYDAVRQAMEGNLALAAANRKVEAGRGAVGQARSDLLPQILVGTAGVIAGRGPNTFGTGTDPGQSALVLGGLKQSIYSDDIWTRYTVEQKKQVSREEERNELQLDTGQDAAIAYLSVLRAKTVRRIHKDNLKLTRSNLELAAARVSAGYALRDEVFRWESEIANGQKTVVSIDAQTRQAEVVLNRVLNRPLEARFSTVEQALDDPAVLGDTRQLFAYIENPRGFQVFRDFEVAEGIRAAPELRRLDALIAASERTILNAERAFYLPDVTMFGTASQEYASQNGGIGGLALPGGIAGVTTNPNAYVGSIGLSFPLFRGGYKKATKLKSTEELRQQQTERDATRQRVEERVRRVLYETGASFPSIRLSQKAADAARKTLDLVENQYSRGTVDIIKLLNSQNAALTANEAAAKAVYDFLIDLAGVQRATGQMSFFQSAEERAAWFQRLKMFFASAGVSPMPQ